jgi:hypothetical protein
VPGSGGNSLSAAKANNQREPARGFTTFPWWSAAGPLAWSASGSAADYQQRDAGMMRADSAGLAIPALLRSKPPTYHPDGTRGAIAPHQAAPHVSKPCRRRIGTAGLCFWPAMDLVNEERHEVARIDGGGLRPLFCLRQSIVRPRADESCKPLDGDLVQVKRNRWIGQLLAIAHENGALTD